MKLNSILYKFISIIKLAIHNFGINFNKFLKPIPLTLSFSAFLAAINYFSIEPSIGIYEVEFDPATSYTINMNKFLEFYENFNLKIPCEILTVKHIKKRYTAIKKNNRAIDEILNSSDLEFINNLEKLHEYKYDPESSFINRIKKLELQLFKSEYDRHVYGHSFTIFSDKEINETTDSLKSKLSNFDYYIFLSAFIYSREFYTRFMIKNTGNVKLKDLNINIFPPVSSISHKRSGNILEYEFQSLMPNIIEFNDEKLIVSVPFLEKDKYFVIFLKTKENRLTLADFYYDFKEDKIINKVRYICIALITYVFLFIFHSYYERNKRIE